MRFSHHPRSTLAAGPECKRLARAIAALGAVAAFATAAVPAAYADSNGLTLSDGWMRMIIKSRPAAGYFTVNNNGNKARSLTGASSPACGKLMLHQSKSVNGVEKMVMVKKVAVPAHGMLKFAPSGYHLMCMKPSADMKPGKEVPVTLRFADGTKLTGRFKVHGAGGK